MIRLTPLALAALTALSMTLLACATPVGDPCTDDAACAHDAFICLKPVVSGAPAATGVCTEKYKVVGEHCLSNDECAPELFCTNDLSTTEKEFSGTCTPRGEAGASCLRARDCASTLRCQGATTTALGTCG